MRNALFVVEEAGDALTSLSHPEDPFNMNWIAGNTPWGTVRFFQPHPGIGHRVERAFTPGGTLRETHTFTNESAYPVFTSLGDIGVYAPFNDSYHDAALCLRERCHAHLWCGGTSSYVMCLRMGGAAPHLGLVLTRGSLDAYSVERDPAASSNDRGDFILHPAPLRLESGDSAVVAWELFWHDGKDDFYKKLRAWPSYVEITADHFVCFTGEQSGLAVVPRDEQGELRIAPDGAGGRVPGEVIHRVTGSGVSAWCRTLTLPPLPELAAARARFIARNQQYHQAGSPLDGAYLIYDNEERRVYYSHQHDHNAIRERVGMGVLIARFLRSGRRDEELETSLKQYVAFVLRECFDPETGTVYNDIGRSADWTRLYNFPWMARFFLEIYGLWRDPVWLRYGFNALRGYYERGGDHFYGIDVPVTEALDALGEAGMRTEAETLTRYAHAHAGAILENGVNYPAHEVKYEQSIVAPAAYTLFQAYRFSGASKYLEGARKQLDVLALFNGRQPDSCLHEAAIRHWDGYWFGKRRRYGDTFPHYWSALTGNVYAEAYRAGCGERWREAAEHSLRGVLGLFLPDGSASCARLYPLTVNGAPADFLDPWANDQDWGLYFALRFFEEAFS